MVSIENKKKGTIFKSGLTIRRLIGRSTDKVYRGWTI